MNETSKFILMLVGVVSLFGVAFWALGYADMPSSEALKSDIASEVVVVEVDGYGTCTFVAFDQPHSLEWDVELVGCV